MSYNHVLLIAIASFQSVAITKVSHNDVLLIAIARAAIAQLGERQTEDLKVPGSIPGLGTRRTPGAGAGVREPCRCHLCRHRSPDG